MEWNKAQDHSKTIIHMDIDCFYVQVELQKNPHLQNEAVGVKQKNIVVTCNYNARKFGVQKFMSVSEALQLCPQLLLFNGEDLYKYRQASDEIHLFLLSFTNRVEKCGLHENYIDISELVQEREKENEQFCSPELIGQCEGNLTLECDCGCHQRLIIGSQIAYEIRTKLKTDLGFTSCCGISYNKILAKVSCCAHKPNEQTTLFPNGTLQFLQNLNGLDEIPGIGGKVKQLLETVNIRTVKDLQEVDLKYLTKIFKNKEYAVNIKNLSLGICDSLVKRNEKLNSIGVENGFRKISVESDVKEKFQILLRRLMVLVEEDGRMPMIVKVTVRQHSTDRKIGYKKTKQSPIPSNLFPLPLGQLTENSADKLLNIIMGLFFKMVNKSKPFHITLLGLAFSKFHEKNKTCSIASFLLRKRDLSVQSLTSLVSDEVSPDVAKIIVPSCNNYNSDSDSGAEPSPKKTKLDVIVQRDLHKGDVEMCSPSKLNVQNLNINDGLNFSELPGDINPTVFIDLPADLQSEIVAECRKKSLKPSPWCSKGNLIQVNCMPKNKI